MADMVNNPPHYKLSNGMEAIDIIEAALTEEEFNGYLKGSVFKYMLREQKKGNRVQDLGKAQWYLNRYRNNVSEEKETKMKSVPVAVIPGKEYSEDGWTASFKLGTENIHDLIEVSSQQDHPAYSDYQLVLTWEKK